jgi:lipopolysaccharide biosynthesis glycosyltransferase
MTAPPPRSGHCLLTITDDGFIDGTEMLVFSFLRHNPWFEGRILVLAGGPLGDASKARLRALADIEFISPGADLDARVASLTQAIPALKRAGPRFASLEAFGLVDFERVVYIDSDAFVTGDLSPLFFDERPLLASPDGSRYDELLGDLDGAREANRQRYGVALSACFNSGVLSIGGDCLQRHVRDALVASIDPHFWRGVETVGWTDQLILNRHFAGRATLLDGRWNYMPILEAKIRRAHRLHCFDARIVHMAGRCKPWEAPADDLFEQAPGLAKFYELWRQLRALLPGAADAACETTRETRGMQTVMQPRTEPEPTP